VEGKTYVKQINLVKPGIATSLIAKNPRKLHKISRKPKNWVVQRFCTSMLLSFQKHLNKTFS